MVIIPNVVSGIPSPFYAGSLAVEPMGDFGKLWIIREKIDFDLRSSEDKGEDTITATYQIKNDGEQFPLELLFISDGIKENSLTIDGVKVAGETVQKPQIPETWKIRFLLAANSTDSPPILGEKII